MLEIFVDFSLMWWIRNCIDSMACKCECPTNEIPTIRLLLLLLLLVVIQWFSVSNTPAICLCDIRWGGKYSNKCEMVSKNFNSLTDCTRNDGGIKMPQTKRNETKHFLFCDDNGVDDYNDYCHRNRTYHKHSLCSTAFITCITLTHPPCLPSPFPKYANLNCMHDT